MAARQKLNQAFVTGSLCLAALAGCLTGSWSVFLVTGFILLVLNVLGGDIRPGKRGR
jgi:hypothetical protein